MPRREYRVRVTCAAEGGCRETHTYYCETRREEDQAYERQRRNPWKCDRHNRPERYLMPGNETTRHVLVASKVQAWRDPRRLDEPVRWLDGLFWLEEGTERSGSGLEHGPGFIAHANEFPEGTRLVVTAQIEMPALDPEAERLAPEDRKD